MRIPVVAGLILGAHVMVIGSTMMIQGCTTSRSNTDVRPLSVEPPSAPVMPPTSEPLVLPPVNYPVVEPMPQFQPPQKTQSTSSSAENIYVVKNGDVLSKIAQAHGVNSRELAELNGITDANKIRVGQKLILPDYAKPSQSKPVAAEKKSPSASAKTDVTASGDTYVVQNGDALSKIAVKFGVKQKDLMELNHITDANKIRVGQKLQIPKNGKSAVKSESKPEAKPVAKAEEKKPETQAKPTTASTVAATPASAPAVAVPLVDLGTQEEMMIYTVQEGDTAESVARMWVVRKEDLLAVNSIPYGEDIKVNQKIKIPNSSL